MHKQALTQAVAAAICGITLPLAANAGDKLFPQHEDGASIVLSGVVTEVDDDEFELRYGDNEIEVELEGWDWDDDRLERVLKVGDRVVVSGEIDDDWFSDRELEAHNFFLPEQGRYFYADDRNPAYENLHSRRVTDDGSYMSLRGEVQRIRGDELVVKSNGKSIKVDTDELGYDPFDGKIDASIEVGDRVYIYGQTDSDFWDKQRFTAEMIVEINDANAS